MYVLVTYTTSLLLDLHSRCLIYVGEGRKKQFFLIGTRVRVVCGLERFFYFLNGISKKVEIIISIRLDFFNLESLGGMSLVCLLFQNTFYTLGGGGGGCVVTTNRSLFLTP